MENKKTDNTQQQSSDQENETKKVVPRENQNDTIDPTATGGSMSEGNLSNSPYSRERTRSFHDKSITLGSDTDGQAN